MLSEQDNVSVEKLQLSGRGHKKQKPIIRKVRQEHGTSILSLPKEIGLKLNQQVMIEKKGSNPLNWEIIIKPILKESPRTIEQLEESKGKGSSQK